MIVCGQEIYFQSSEQMSSVPDGSVNFFFTSPPYWNLKDYGDERQIGKGSYEEYIARLVAVWRECYRKGTPRSVLVINVNSRRHKKKFYPLAFDIVSSMEEWTFWDHVIWYVPNALPQPNYYRERVLDNKFESCLVFTKDDYTGYTFHKPRVRQKYADADPRKDKLNPDGRGLGNIVRIPAYRPPNVKKLGYHVAAFPEELVAFFLECYTDEGDVVLDPFLGSGTTLKVCKIMGRKGIGFEVNEDYEELIRQRIDESWEVPEWEQIDLIHSTTATTGRNQPRKIQHHKTK